mgnify:CR=1 FL=1
MKTFIIQNKKHIRLQSIVLVMLMFAFYSTSVTAQNGSSKTTITVKGKINSEFGPLANVSIYLKNSNEGTVSKKDGTFTFPSALKAGDVLIFSYLGFEKQAITITNSSNYLDVFMKEAPIDVLSAPNSNRPYKSKRPKS